MIQNQTLKTTISSRCKSQKKNGSKNYFFSYNIVLILNIKIYYHFMFFKYFAFFIQRIQVRQKLEDPKI